MSFIKQRLKEYLLKENNEFLTLLNNLNANQSDKKNIFVYSLNNSKIFFKLLSNKNIEIDLIETHSDNRGAGEATSILKNFLKNTDNLGFNVELIVAPRDKSTDTKKLAEFYKKNGFDFKFFNGFESDFEMIRRKRK